jgi:hypothetical protein
MQNYKYYSALVMSSALLAFAGCDKLDIGGDGGLCTGAICDAIGEVVDDLAVCPEVCLQIETCGANPPPPANVGSLGDSVLPDNGIAACATNCAQVNTRHRLGYSDCQIECLQETSCGKLEECWDTRSTTYKNFCLQDVEVPVIAPEPAPAPTGGTDAPMGGTEMPMMSIDNGTTTGNEEVDTLVQDPALAVAVEASETPINFGNNPPTLAGEYSVEGGIDRARNARQVGSPIRTAICFESTETLAGGTFLTYCERGVPGTGRAPITGDGNNFSAFFEINGAPVTILFSGTLNDDSSVTGAEALVTYTVGTDVWEHSETNWTQANPSCSCPL